MPPAWPPPPPNRAGNTWLIDYLPIVEQSLADLIEWGEGLVERLSDHHLDIRLERGTDSDVRVATWQWRGQP